MNALNLYAKIEQDLDFKDEVQKLYDAYDLLISQINPQSLIDIGCGQGDFLLQIQDQSLNTFGIDLSSEQINICKQKNINAKCIKICDVKDNFDVASAVFDVLNYIPAQMLKEFLQCVYSRLNDKGYFLFDVNSLFGFEEVAQGTLSIDKSDKFINIDAYYEDKKLNTNITLFTKNQNNTYTKHQECIEQYYHSKEDLEKLLKSIGFKIDNIINFHLHDDENSDKYIFICTK